MKKVAKPWWDELEECLSRAAEICAEHDIDVDVFMRGAWSAFISARPGLKEHLEDLQLQFQLDEIRKAGRMGSA